MEKRIESGQEHIFIIGIDIEIELIFIFIFISHSQAPSESASQSIFAELRAFLPACTLDYRVSIGTAER